MNDDASLIKIVFFAAIAVFLLLRLRAVLGRRTGEEREQPNPLERPPNVPFRPGLLGQGMTQGARPALVIEPDPALPQSLDARLARVAAADPSFDEKHFIAGARAAFQAVVEAFAAGDLSTLRTLLSSHLYGEFGRAISERPRHDPPDSIAFDGPIAAEIVDARVVGGEIQCQVRFASRQRRAADATPAAEEIVDLWTFARDSRSRDPNWQVIETASGE